MPTTPRNLTARYASLSVLALFVVLGVRPTLAQDANAKPDPPKRTFQTMIDALTPDEVVTYKNVGDTELKLHIFRPKGATKDTPRPAYVVIHGGGWRSNTAQRFYPYANSLVDHGFVGISVEYRLASKDKTKDNATTVFDCVKDARAAVRYVRANAKQLGVDPDRIAVGGGSAGGHLALAAALFDGIDHEDEDLSVSCRPDALVLLFAVLDTSKEGYGHAFIGEDWKKLSPRHHIRPGMPPTILFHGDKDRVAPLPILNRFCKAMEENDVAYRLVLEQGGVHGYINNDMQLFDAAARQTHAFLLEHGFGPGNYVSKPNQ